MSLKVSDWFRQLGFPSFRSMHFEEQGESGLTSRARVLVQNRLRRTAVENRNRERDMVAGFS
jgi:hypothetical protein